MSSAATTTTAPPAAAPPPAAIPATPPEEASRAPARRDGINAALCACAALLLALAALPFAESGINDDWSFAHSAKVLAETGRLTYNGWSAPLVGVQAYWGALWVKLFGFSFTVLRLSLLPFAGGVAALTYLLLRRADVLPAAAVFGTLALASGPLFVPNAASFMTDVSSLFFLLLALYGAVRALEAADAAPPGRVAAWAGVAAVAGYLGGTVRQAVWVAIPVWLFWVVWRNRGNRAVLAATVLSCAAAVATNTWFSRQPYTRSLLDPQLVLLALERFPALKYVLAALGGGALLFAAVLLRARATPPGSRSRAFARWACFLFVLAVTLVSARLFLCLLLVAVPLSVAVFPERFRQCVRHPAAWVATAAVLFLVPLATRAGYAAPWAWNTLTLSGLYGTVGLLGARPNTFGDTITPWLVLGVLALALSTVWLAPPARALVAWLRTGEPLPLDSAPLPVRLYASFCLAYLLLMTPQAAAGQAYDRYLLPLHFGLALALLRHVRRPNPLAWAALAAWGVYAVATTHDYHAIQSAAASQVARLESRGVPRRSVRATFEADGWTQCLERGHVNARGMKNAPPGAYAELSDDDVLRAGAQAAFAGNVPFWWKRTPAVAGEHFVTLSPLPNLADAPDVPPVPYRTGLPWGGGTVRVQQPAPEPAGSPAR